ncbi:hypothetical protein [[Mycoplasma] testudinis]|uniref:hypothetical protein n=1 Tax=[Mycoplasma] testudinis TaxID=33924 RepID=UPI00048267BD|nr:hypothetical protein [[Mycoplasma] testudinis]
MEWLKNYIKCPTCRALVKKDQPTYEFNNKTICQICKDNLITTPQNTQYFTLNPKDPNRRVPLSEIKDYWMQFRLESVDQNLVDKLISIGVSKLVFWNKKSYFIPPGYAFLPLCLHTLNYLNNFFQSPTLKLIIQDYQNDFNIFLTKAKENKNPDLDTEQKIASQCIKQGSKIIVWKRSQKEKIATICDGIQSYRKVVIILDNNENYLDWNYYLIKYTKRHDVLSMLENNQKDLFERSDLLNQFQNQNSGILLITKKIYKRILKEADEWGWIYFDSKDPREEVCIIYDEAEDLLKEQSFFIDKLNIPNPDFRKNLILFIKRPIETWVAKYLTLVKLVTLWSNGPLDVSQKYFFHYKYNQELEKNRIWWNASFKSQRMKKFFG